MTERHSAKVEASSGNVFEDLGLADAAAELSKADLAFQIAHLAKAQGLDGTGTARTLGISQPKASLLLRGRTDGFSTEKLLHYLTMLGQDVRIVISAKPASVAKGRLLVQIRARRIGRRQAHKVAALAPSRSAGKESGPKSKRS
ncbi:MAG: XRE family transcriptional regulator [Gemmatimonadales bacterium]|nr:XRE family transcriptional regulator [Gemmatimonadales bacterium]